MPPGSRGKSNYSHWNFENWQGAYDLEVLAANVDLICLMTYSEHPELTPPGPIAAYPGQFKISITRCRLFPKRSCPSEYRPTVLTVSGPDAQLLIETYCPHVQGDDDDKSTWFFRYRAGAREWGFSANRRTFQTRYSLATERGCKVFVPGSSARKTQASGMC
jgi:spore germination protein YaaH